MGRSHESAVDPGRASGVTPGRKGPRKQAIRPERERPDNQRRHGKAKRFTSGEAITEDGVGVGDAGMRAGGPHTDLGTRSACPPRVEEGALSEGSGVAWAGGAKAVGELKEVGRVDQEGRWSGRTDGAPYTGRSGKDSWSTDGELRGSTGDSRKQRDVWWGTLPTLCSRRSQGGEAGRFLGSVVDPRARGDLWPRHPNRSRQRDAGKRPARLGVADGGAQALPPSLWGSVRVALPDERDRRARPRGEVDGPMGKPAKGRSQGPGIERWPRSYFERARTPPSPNPSARALDGPRLPPRRPPHQPSSSRVLRRP